MKQLKLFKLKLSIIRKILSSSKFMAITGTDKSFNVVTTYTDAEITRSGKAVYFH